MNLERQLESIGHITVTEILYYDLEANIRIKEENTIENIEDTIEELNPIEYMENTTSSSNLPQQQPIVYNPGNIPRPTYNEYREPIVKYKSKGKKYSLKALDKKKLLDEGLTLNLTAYDPQLWNNTIDHWKYKVVRHYIQKGFDHSTSEMYTYLET